MPCSDSRDSFPHTEYVDNPETKQRLDHVTRLLCFVMGRLEVTPNSPYSDLIMTNGDLRAWWTHHKIQDLERLAREKQAVERAAARNAALAKLTAEERKALGL